MPSPEEASIFSEPWFWTAVVGVAGILATFFSPPWAQRRMERRAEAREFRRARRLVASEMETAASFLRYVLHRQELPPAEITGAPVTLSQNAWDAERPVLATSLDEHTWEQVRHAQETLAGARLAMLSEAEWGGGAGSPIEGENAEALEMAAGFLESAQSLLVSARSVKD